MWTEVGIQRDYSGLSEAQELLADWESYLSRLAPFTPQGVEVLNMIQVASAITRCASFRKESRGAHYRSDYPNPSDDWKSHTCYMAADNQTVIWSEANEWAIPEKA